LDAPTIIDCRKRMYAEITQATPRALCVGTSRILTFAQLSLPFKHEGIVIGIVRACFVVEEPAQGQKRHVQCVSLTTEAQVQANKHSHTHAHAHTHTRVRNTPSHALYATIAHLKGVSPGFLSRVMSSNCLPCFATHSASLMALVRTSDAETTGRGRIQGHCLSMDFCVHV
jgi:hypothetical protein